MPRTPVRIAIVDDDALVADALALLARDAGYEVAVASDVGEASDLCTSFRPDVIFCDVQQPRCADAAAIAGLHALALGAPIIAMSGAAAMAPLALAAGASSFLAKPFSAAHMLAAIERVLGFNRAAPAAA